MNEVTLDDVLDAMTNRLESGDWHWWCGTPCGGPLRATKEEAKQDFLDWVRKIAPKQRAKCNKETKTTFTIVEAK